MKSVLKRGKSRVGKNERFKWIREKEEETKEEEKTNTKRGVTEDSERERGMEEEIGRGETRRNHYRKCRQGEEDAKANKRSETERGGGEEGERESSPRE